MYEFAHAFYKKQLSNVLFLQAERGKDGQRTFKLVEGTPLQTSFGIDLYKKVSSRIHKLGVFMIEIKIPGFGDLKLKNVIFDYNGTLAVGGYLIEGIATQLNDLSKRLSVHIVTGDRFGTAKNELQNVHCELVIIPPGNQAIAKKNYLQKINPNETACVGNGRNDELILKEAILGIAVLGSEGASIEALNAADLAVHNIFDVFKLFQYPSELEATLRS